MATLSRVKDEGHSIEAALQLGGDAAKIIEFYAGWAVDYDTDVGGAQYGVADAIVDLLNAAGSELWTGFDRTEVSIVDAGCGTGLVGARLAADGYRNLYGVDLSVEMIEQARRRGVYSGLQAGFDLTAPIHDRWIRAYDAAIVAGVFTFGHVGPEYLSNMADLVRSGGLLLISSRAAYHDETNFDAVIAPVIESGRLRIARERRNISYTPDSVGHYFAYEVTHSPV